MKTTTTASFLALLALSSARPTANHFSVKREVPQEHSHEKFLTSVRASLNLNNPAGISDPVFGLLGNAAASTGAGSIANPDCLHKATADQAFTNAKAAGDVQAQADALVYAALERNTGAVGQASVICNEPAVNPEVEAISQHQDPASANAAATNKAITLELAKQLGAIGADPLLALESGTFAPGQIGDPTGAGNTCDDANDPVGCIFTLNRLVEDATPEEVQAAAGGAGAGAGGGAGGGAAAPASSTAAAPAVTEAPAAGDNGAACPAVTTVTVDPPAATPAAGENGQACPAPSTVTVEAPAAPTAAPPAQSAPPAAGGNANGNNVQTFTGSLGGAPPPVINTGGARPFTVNGNTFVNIGAALQRSCAIQNNACANAVNSGALQLPGRVGDCNKQEKDCNAAASAAARRLARSA